MRRSRACPGPHLDGVVPTGVVLAMAKLSSPLRLRWSKVAGPTSTALERRCSVAYVQDGVSSEGERPWERSCRITYTHGVSFPLFKNTDQNIPWNSLGTLTCWVQNSDSLFHGEESAKKNPKEKPSCHYLYSSLSTKR